MSFLTNYFIKNLTALLTGSLIYDSVQMVPRGVLASNIFYDSIQLVPSGVST